MKLTSEWYGVKLNLLISWYIVMHFIRINLPFATTVLCLVAQSCPLSTPRAAAHRLLCPWGFSRQEYWSGLPCPPPRDLPNPGAELRYSASQEDSLLTEPPEEPFNNNYGCNIRHFRAHGSISVLYWIFLGLPGGFSGKESAWQYRRHKKHGFAAEVRKIPWRRAWQPTPVFLPGESQGQGCLAGYSPWGYKE